eukprot:8283492-Pyramimonas_sp.AAC.1
MIVVFLFCFGGSPRLSNATLAKALAGAPVQSGSQGAAIFLLRGNQDDDAVDQVASIWQSVKGDFGANQVKMEEVSAIFAAIGNPDAALSLRMRWALVRIRFSYASLAISMRGITAKPFNVNAESVLETWTALIADVSCVSTVNLSEGAQAACSREAAEALEIHSRPTSIRTERFDHPVGTLK